MVLERVSKMPFGSDGASQGLKPAFLLAHGGTAEEAAEKANSRCPAPKGAFDFEGLPVSLKRYPDTKPDFSRSL
jgi:hypothetical protein